MKYNNIPRVSVEVEVEAGCPSMHPRMAAMWQRIANEVGYLEEHGQGADYSQDALDFLECMHRKLKQAPEGHPIKLRWRESIESVLAKWRPDALQNKEQDDGQD